MDRGLIADCVHCGFCLPTCPTYELWHEEMDSPRGRIWLMEAALDGTVSLNRTVVEHFDRCLGCVACVSSCPSGVRYGTLIELTRERVEQEFRRPPSERLLRAAAFAVLPHPRRLRSALALAEVARRLPSPRPLRDLLELAPRLGPATGPPPETPAAGERVGRVGLVTGCVQRAAFGRVSAATARVLAADGLEVDASVDGCCGALHLHAGRREDGLARARRLAEGFRRAGAEAIVVDAAGCGSHLKDAGLELPVLDVSEAVTGRAERRPLRLRVAYQDACHLGHAQRLGAEPRALLAAIPELALVEPDEQELCCGSAGIYNLVQPQAARALGMRKAAHVAATGADVYAAGNPGCLIQVTAALRRAGTPLPAVHPVELVDASIRGVPAADVTDGARAAASRRRR